jgi:membrane protein DedA with SNARE-associated domain
VDRFTPAIVSGTAKMRHGQFVVWNLIASLAFAVSVAASSYGVGRLATGHFSPRDVVTLLVGLAVGGVGHGVVRAPSPVRTAARRAPG